MSRRGILIIACALGCNSGSGVELELRSSVAFDRAELFIAQGPCTQGAPDFRPCPQVLHWKDQQNPPYDVGTQIHTLADNAGWFAPVAGGIARFRIEVTEATKATKAIDKLAVVGYTCADHSDPSCTNRKIVASATLDSPTIPLNHVERWNVTLDPTDNYLDDAVTEPPPGAGKSGNAVRRAVTWSKADPTLASCAMVQRWDGTAWQTDYFAPPDDPDCDGYVDNSATCTGAACECDPYWYRFRYGQPASTCVTSYPLSAGATDACVVGSSLCADGAGASRKCFPILGTGGASCVPGAWCDCTEPGTLNACIDATTVAWPTSPATMTFIECTQFPVFGGMACGANNANQRQFVLPAPCNSAVLYQLGLPEPAPLDQTMFQVGDGTAKFSLHLIDTAQCTFRLSWDSGTPSTAPVNPFLLDVSYPTHHVLVPLEIGFAGANTCPIQANPDCAIIDLDGDTVFGCAN